MYASSSGKSIAANSFSISKNVFQYFSVFALESMGASWELDAETERPADLEAQMKNQTIATISTPTRTSAASAMDFHVASANAKGCNQLPRR